MLNISPAYFEPFMLAVITGWVLVSAFVSAPLLNKLSDQIEVKSDFTEMRLVQIEADLEGKTYQEKLSEWADIGRAE